MCNLPAFNYMISIRRKGNCHQALELWKTQGKLGFGYNKYSYALLINVCFLLLFKLNNNRQIFFVSQMFAKFQDEENVTRLFVEMLQKNIPTGASVFTTQDTPQCDM
jgi:hypothetical protein